MHLPSLPLGVVGVMASLVGAVVVAEEGHAHAAVFKPQDLGGRTQRNVARFAQQTPVTLAEQQLSRSILMPTLSTTLSTSLNWGGTRSQRFVARFAQDTPIWVLSTGTSAFIPTATHEYSARVSDIRRGEDQAAAEATSLPLCCFNQAKGQYDCPCRKPRSDKTRKSDSAIPPPNSCTPCWQAMKQCHARCDGDRKCHGDCDCDTYRNVPMCQRCPWAIRECGNLLTRYVVEARDAAGEKAMTTNTNNVLDSVIPTTMVTIVARGPKCKCRDCNTYGRCHLVPCACGSAGAFEGEPDEAA